MRAQAERYTSTITLNTFASNVDYVHGSAKAEADGDRILVVIDLLTSCSTGELVRAFQEAVRGLFPSSSVVQSVAV